MKNYFNFCLPPEYVSYQWLLHYAPRAAKPLHVIDQLYRVNIDALTEDEPEFPDIKIPVKPVTEMLDNFSPAKLYEDVEEATLKNYLNGIKEPCFINVDVRSYIRNVSNRYFKHKNAQHDCLLIQRAYIGGLMSFCNRHYLPVLPVQTCRLTELNVDVSMIDIPNEADGLASVIRGFNELFSLQNDVTEQLQLSFISKFEEEERDFLVCM